MDSLLFLGALLGIGVVVIGFVMKDDRKANVASRELLQKLSARAANSPDTDVTARGSAPP
jgi:hypothetical protein